MCQLEQTISILTAATTFRILHSYPVLEVVNTRLMERPFGSPLKYFTGKMYEAFRQMNNEWVLGYACDVTIISSTKN